MVLLFHFSLLPVIIQLLFDDALGIHLEFYEEAKSWIEALAHCQRNNSSLVEICNKTVRDEVKNILQNKILQDGVWIGLEQPIFGNKDEWKWISGSKLLYAQLNSSDSVNGINNHCGKIIFGNEAKEIKWLDDNCHEKLPYICKEREASSSSCSRQEKDDDDNIGSEEKGDSGEEEEGQGSKEEDNSGSKEKGDSGEEGGHGSKEESDHSKEKGDSSSKEKGDSGEEGGHGSKEESDHSKEKGDSSKEKGTV